MTPVSPTTSSRGASLAPEPPAPDGPGTVAIAAQETPAHIKRLLGIQELGWQMSSKALNGESPQRPDTPSGNAEW